MNVIAQALAENPVARTTDIKQYILSKKDFDGVSGKITFDQTGGVKKKPLFWRIEDNRYKRIS